MVIGEDGYPLVSSEKDYIGNREPKMRFGLTNTVSYKNFTLSVLIDGAYSADILNATSYSLLHNGSNAMLTEYRNKEFIFEGKVGHVDNDGELVVSNTANSQKVILDYDYFRKNYGLVGTNFVETVSWLRVRNVSLEYVLPKKWVEKIKASSASVNLGVNNLYLLTDYTGGDPEVNNAGANGGGASGAGTMGVDYYQVPVSRTMTLGFNIKF